MELEIWLTTTGGERFGTRPLASNVGIHSLTVIPISLNNSIDLFSHLALSDLEPRIRRHLDFFLMRLHEQIGQPIDISFWVNLLSFDVMGEVGFSKDFHMMSNGKEHKAIKGLHDSMVFIGILSHVPWLMQLVGSIPGLTGAFGDFVEWCNLEVTEKQKVC